MKIRWGDYLFFDFTIVISISHEKVLVVSSVALLLDFS